ncbi:MAG TPA: hypothetical protein VK797_21095 [Tepidisphaeraceae bacterium]|jgi:hypothetical protein|nr:hypothetical protein [Tepidisphaeraceae bacterium]
MSYDDTQDTTSSEHADDGAGVPALGGGDEFDPTLVAGDLPKSNNRSLAILGGLLTVAAIVIWFVYFRGAPESAQGAMAPNDGGSQIKQFLDSGNINIMKQTLKETEKIVKQFRSYPGRTQIPLASLRSNPFRELAPKADQPVTANSSKDDEKEQELHKQAADAVAEIKVQSIIRGSKYRACMINNTLYKEGQQIGILRIDRITANAIVVSSGKYRFEVPMEK